MTITAKGFRPFFLLAGAFAALILPVWLLTLAGVLGPVRYLDAVTWHAHEMIFGFALAVVAGFLLTAVGNWTGRETLVGAPPAMTASFALVTLAALVRVAGPLVDIAAYRAWVFLAGGLWTAAFALFVVVVAPVVIAARVDGKPG